MKKTKLKLEFGIVLLFLVMSSRLYAQDEIDPPPPAPIDDYINLAVIFGLLLGVYLVVKHNLKSETK